MLPENAKPDLDAQFYPPARSSSGQDSALHATGWGCPAAPLPRRTSRRWPPPSPRSRPRPPRRTEPRQGLFPARRRECRTYRPPNVPNIVYLSQSMSGYLPGGKANSSLRRSKNARRYLMDGLAPLCQAGRRGWGQHDRRARLYSRVPRHRCAQERPPSAAQRSARRRDQQKYERASMTVAHVYTVAFQGIEAREVDVQVHIGEGGGGQFNIVGLADKAVAESRERVRAALTRHRPGAAVQAHHRQSGAGRSAQGRQPLRPAHRAGIAGGDGRAARQRDGELCGAGRTVAGCGGDAGGGRAAGGAGGVGTGSRA